MHSGSTTLDCHAVRRQNKIKFKKIKNQFSIFDLALFSQKIYKSSYTHELRKQIFVDEFDRDSKLKNAKFAKNSEPQISISILDNLSKLFEK